MHHLQFPLMAACLVVLLRIRQRKKKGGWNMERQAHFVVQLALNFGQECHLLKDSFAHRRSIHACKMDARGTFMTEKKPEKCAHPGCNCPPAAVGKYCGLLCKSIGDRFFSFGQCGHSGCPRADAK